MSQRPFRFGVVAGQLRSADDWVARARSAQGLGYSTFLVPDTIGYTPTPIPALAVAAAVTSSIRIGTYVLANDFRNPVLVAREAAALDFLSGGRFELGLGAGRPTAGDDYRKLGIPFDPGSARVERLTESLAIIKAVLSGQTANPVGPHYAVAGADVFPKPVQQPRPPILVAASGKRLLGLAAREADIVALGVSPDADEATVKEKVAWVRHSAGDRAEQLELNLNLVAVGQQVNQQLLARMGLDLVQLERIGSPSVLTGSPEQMTEMLLARRESLGVSYVTVADFFMEAFAPVVERLAGR